MGRGFGTFPLGTVYKYTSSADGECVINPQQQQHQEPMSQRITEIWGGTHVDDKYFNNEFDIDCGFLFKRMAWGVRILNFPHMCVLRKDHKDNSVINAVIP